MIKKLLGALMTDKARSAASRQFDIGYSEKPRALNLFAWHEVRNFGDKLGPALFHWLSGKPTCIEARGLSLTFDQPPPRTIYCFLGTLAQFLSGPHRFVLWGMGISPPEGPSHHGCRPIEPGLNLEIRALRGPLTRKVLMEAGYKIQEDLPYGDPGLLIPYFFKPSTEKVDGYCLVPHHTQYRRWKEMFPRERVIDINIDYPDLQSIVSQVTKYRAVFSSSLHTCILAESLGVPAIPVEPSLPFKFDDFYLSIHKRVAYINHLDRDLDFEDYFHRARHDYHPLKWDPRPWIAAAPFPCVDKEDLTVQLTEHYRRIGKRRLEDAGD